MDMASQNKGKVKKVFGIIGVVLFFLSYLPFIPLIEVGIHGVQSGLFGGPYIYGFDAIANVFLWLCIIPIYPICILYQLIFGIAYIRKRKTLKLVTIAVVACLVVIIVGVGLLDSDEKKNRVEAARPQIVQYLTDKYGNGFVTEDTRLRLYNPDEDAYMVTTDVLPDGIEFSVYLRDEHDDLINSFCGRNEGFQDDFEEYVNEQNNIPDNMTLQMNINSIEFGSYQYGDDYTVLFDRVDYTVTGLIVDLDSATDDEVEELIYEVWEEQFPKFDNQDFYEYVAMHIRVNGDFVYNVVYYVDSRTAEVSLYRPTNIVSELEGAELQMP